MFVDNVELFEYETDNRIMILVPCDGLIIENTYPDGSTPCFN